MADPKQRSLELPSFLSRIVPVWMQPTWLEAERWRRVVTQQDIAGLCMNTLISDMESATWQVRPKDPKEEDILADDIEAYTDILNPEMPGGLDGFDAWMSQMCQDMLTIPVGGNSEVIRWPDGMGPFSRPHDNGGHVWGLAFMDGATVTPTNDREFPLMQKMRGDVSNAVFFTRPEITRWVTQPRVDLNRWGYGMAPPERGFLAITLLYRGDQYYANLLLDTPEAGLLDLGMMEKETAVQWASSFRELFQGIDPFKIPILYETERPPSFVSFGRPPTEMMFDSVTLRYAQITAASYGLTLHDIGMGAPENTLAGSIRDERRSRRSGYGVVREKIRTAINRDILPKYLEFVWVENDEETRVQKGRSFLLLLSALEKAKKAGFISTREGQAIIQDEGFITMDLEEPEEQPQLLLPSPSEPAIDQELDRVPVSEGGRGDITASATFEYGDPVEPGASFTVQGPDLGDAKISAIPTNSPTIDQMAIIWEEAFEGVMARMEPARVERLMKVATKAMFPDVVQAFLSFSETLDEAELPLQLKNWQEERVKLWFEQDSLFSEYPDTLQASADILAQIEKALNQDKWWNIAPEIAAAILEVTKQAFSEGALRAAEEAWRFLYTEGFRDTPNLIGLSFNLKNPATLKELSQSAAELVRRVNDGTKFFLKRIIASAVDEGLSSPNIVKMIQDGANVTEVLKDTGFKSTVVERAGQEVSEMSKNRITSIVNTEVARAETDGRVAEWSHMGLTRKEWVHTGPDVPCSFCQANINRGFIPIDDFFEGVFGPINGPPAHPTVDHCHIAFDEEELINRSDELEVWMGE